MDSQKKWVVTRGYGEYAVKDLERISQDLCHGGCKWTELTPFSVITEDPQSIDIGNQAMSYEEAKKESKSNYSSIEWNGYEWEIQLSWIEEVEVDSDESPYECGRWCSLICFDEEAEKSFEEIMKDNESEELEDEEKEDNGYDVRYF